MTDPILEQVLITLSEFHSGPMDCRHDFDNIACQEAQCGDFILCRRYDRFKRGIKQAIEMLGKRKAIESDTIPMGVSPQILAVREPIPIDPHYSPLLKLED